MEKGLVIKSTGNLFIVKTDRGEKYECRLKGSFRIKGIRTTNPIAIGDYVWFEISSNNEKIAVIDRIEQRRNYILRKSSNLSKESQILAANIDQVYLIVTVNHPVTTTLFIDRFLVTAEAYDIPVHIVFNKIDLCHSKDLKKLEELNNIYRKIGYSVSNISIKENKNIEGLVQSMMGKTNLLSGHSGVGKSSLLNYITNSYLQKTTEISDIHNKGKHTTTFSEMFEIKNGSFYLIDTPGISGFGLIDLSKEEISHYFPEMFTLLKQCQYYNCTHTHEPGCAVKKGIEEGIISVSRYKNYLNMIEDNQNKYRL